MRILVIEDDLKVANFISSGLGQEGYSVDVLHEGTEAGAQALAWLSCLPFSCLLSSVF